MDSMIKLEARKGASRDHSRIKHQRLKKKSDIKSYILAWFWDGFLESIWIYTKGQCEHVTRFEMLKEFCCRVVTKEEALHHQK